MNGSSELIDFKISKNINRYEIPNVEQYIEDLMNVEYSFSGRMDAEIANSFILESVQLIINSINIFRLGYFDAAYYSLREAIEISTTIVYLVDMPDEIRIDKLEAWKNVEPFPMQGKMFSQLYKKGLAIPDMKQKMESFFIDVDFVRKDINKYVHKQGLNNFYVFRSNPLYMQKEDDSFIESFCHYLEKTIGIIAVMRLAIDPYPVLLMDEEILYRCFDSMTTPYSESFVERYISNKTINDYKKTEMFINHYNNHILDEKKNLTIFEIEKHLYINTSKKEEIISQFYLLNQIDRIITYIALLSKKVVKLYAHNGIYMYFTDRKTNRKAQNWRGLDFKKFKENDNRYNQIYDEALISVFEYTVGSELEVIFVEHNEKLDEDDINTICNLSIENCEKGVLVL